MLPKTAKILLRPFQPSDFDSLVALMTDAETMRYTGFQRPQSLERIGELLSKWQQEGAQELGVWAVDDRASLSFVGWAMLKNTTSKTPEIGYMIDKKYWGQGFATAIAQALASYAFDILKLPKITALTSADNFASVRILEKMGMTVRGDASLADGGVYYELSAVAWYKGVGMPANTMSKQQIWVGRILSGLAVLFLVFDAVTKFFMDKLPPAAREAGAVLQWPDDKMPLVGFVLLICTLLYAIPRSAVVGAVLLTGYLGGAVASHVRVANPLFTHTLFPVYVAIFVWLGLYLRDSRVKALISK